MLKYLTINDAEYSVSNSANVNDAKGDSACDPKTVTNTSDRKKIKVTDTRNRILQQKLLSNRTLPVVAPTMDPRIDNRIETGGGDSHTLSTPATKEVIADAARGSAWFNWNPRHVIRTGRDCSTPCDTGIAVRYTWAHSPVMIGSPTISRACVISGRLQVGKKQQSTSLDKVRNAQKLETVIDRKFPND